MTPPIANTTVTRSRRNLWFLALRVLGTIIVFCILFHILPISRVWAAIRHVPVRLGLLVLAGYLAAHVVAICKWRLTVNLAGAGLDFAQAARCYFTGLFATLFLPSIVGGDVVRAGLALRASRSKAGVLLGSLIDRMLDLAALLSLAGVGALSLGRFLTPFGRSVLLRAMVGGVCVALVVVVVLGLFPARRFSFRMRRRLVRLREALHSMLANKRLAFLSLLLGLAVQSCFIALTARIAGACGLHLAFRSWLFAWPLAKLSGVLPLTQGGIGVREAVLAILLAPFGAPATSTVAVGLVWEAIVILGGLCAGLLALLLHQVRPDRP